MLDVRDFYREQQPVEHDIPRQMPFLSNRERGGVVAETEQRERPQCTVDARLERFMAAALEERHSAFRCPLTSRRMVATDMQEYGRLSPASTSTVHSTQKRSSGFADAESTQFDDCGGEAGCATVRGWQPASATIQTPSRSRFTIPTPAA